MTQLSWHCSTQLVSKLKIIKIKTTITTWTKKQLIIDHILQVVFDLPPDSDLEKILIHNGYHQPTDFVIEKDETLDGLAYPNDAKAMVKIMKGDAGLLKSFKHYAAFQAQQGTPFDTDEWVTITAEQFDQF